MADHDEAPTPLTKASAKQAHAMLALLQQALADNLVAVYLHGSAVRGGLRPYSDLDVLAVTAERLMAGGSQQLVDGVLMVSSPRRPVELTIVSASEIRPWHHPARREFQYGEWLRNAVEAGDLEAVARVVDPDLTLLIAMALDASCPLYGPPAEAVFEPVPSSDIRAALLDELPAVVRWTESDTRNALLTLARIWSTLSVGRFYSKSAAAAWALERLPAEHRAVLSRARDIYLGEEPEQWDGLAAEIKQHTDFVASQIQALAAHAGIGDRAIPEAADWR